VRAIIVYPMNALANSQPGELEKFRHVFTPQAKWSVGRHHMVIWPYNSRSSGRCHRGRLDVC